MEKRINLNNNYNNFENDVNDNSIEDNNLDFNNKIFYYK